jgi:hypothetical protein
MIVITPVRRKRHTHANVKSQERQTKEREESKGESVDTRKY